MDIKLSLFEARVIGCLLEKEIATPEQYPLSLNALTNACNQKSSRDPVLELSESAVQDVVDALIKKYLVSEKSGFGSRVVKYQHRFCNTGFGDLKLSEQELAVLCVLLLRGPQTPGELRTRTDRLCKFSDVREVESVLEKLIARDDGPFVARLPREPGKRESRYAQLFTGALPETDTAAVAPTGVGAAPSTQERLTRLEEEMTHIRAALAEFEARLAQLESVARTHNE